MLEKQENSLIKRQIIRMDEKTLDWKYDTDEKVWANVPILETPKGRKYFRAYGRHYIDEFVESGEKANV
jgi:hypothetical protein